MRRDRAAEARAFRCAVAVAVLACGTIGSWLVLDSGTGAWTRRAVVAAAVIVAPLVAAVACGKAARRRPACARGWGLLAGATLLWTSGAVVRARYGLVLHQPPPLASFADIACLGSGLPAAAALTRVGLTPGGGRMARGRLVIDGALIMVSLLLLSWLVVLDGPWRSDQVRGLGGVVQVAYPCVDVVLAAMVMALGSRQPAGYRLRWALLGAGIVTLALSDSASVVATFHGTSLTGAAFDAGRVASFLLVTLAALAPTSPHPAASAQVRTSLLQDFLPYLPVLAALAVGIRTFPRLSADLADGDVVWISLTLAMVVLLLLGQLAMLLDNRALSHSLDRGADELRHLALHDPLTGLANRTLFSDRLRQAVARGARRRESVAVLILDLDRFTSINDSLGHSAGDKLLTEVGRRLSGCLRPGDTVARLGGDEYAVLLEDLAESGPATVIAARLLDELHPPLTVGEATVIIQASVGIVTSSPGAESADELLRYADLAMHAAKETGGDRCTAFARSMRDSTVAALELETDLRHGLRDGEFIVHFQPLTRVASGRLSGVEALARWRHPRRGMVSPLDFIPAAEATGLIRPLGDWVLQQACDQMSNWHRRYPNRRDLSVAVNVSGAQLRPELVGTVNQALASSGLPATALVLEVTESLLMDHAAGMLDVLEQVRALGVRVAIDDFGTGYSSLSRLNVLPVDILKIHKSFVDEVTTDRTGGVVAGMISMAHSLHLQVVAEGVEDREQLEVLRRHGCDEVQGYLLARPMAARGVEELLVQADAGPSAADAPPPTAGAVQAGPLNGRSHRVLVHRDEVQVVRELCAYVLGGLADEGHAVVIATPGHTAALRLALPPEQLACAEAGGRLVYRDVEATLARFMRDGRPDAELFDQTVGALLREHASGTGVLYAYGEMVLALWQEAGVTGALQLEQLWNDLQRRVAFHLLTAHPGELTSSVGRGRQARSAS